MAQSNEACGAARSANHATKQLREHGFGKDGAQPGPIDETVRAASGNRPWFDRPGKRQEPKMVMGAVRFGGSCHGGRGAGAASCAPVLFISCSYAEERQGRCNPQGGGAI